MSTNTPKQSQPPLNESFSPVILPESPAALTPQRNLTGLPRVARDIAADIYNNIQHWNTLHINGANIVKEIALIKSDNPQLHPEGLEPMTENLAEIISGLKIITNSLKTCSQQIKSLEKLHKSPTPLFISWPMEKMSDVGSTISAAYSQEYKLKEFIFENIPHIEGKDRLMFYAAGWAHQPYISTDIDRHLESLLTETGHRK